MPDGNYLSVLSTYTGPHCLSPYRLPGITMNEAHGHNGDFRQADPSDAISSLVLYLGITRRDFEDCRYKITTKKFTTIQALIFGEHTHTSLPETFYTFSFVICFLSAWFIGFLSSIVKGCMRSRPGWAPRQSTLVAACTTERFLIFYHFWKDMFMFIRCMVTTHGNTFFRCL